MSCSSECEQWRSIQMAIDQIEELRSEVLPTSLYVDGQVRYTRLAR